MNLAPHFFLVFIGGLQFIAPWLSGEEPSRVEKILNLREKSYEIAAKDALTNFAAEPFPLKDLAKLYAGIAGRGGEPRELVKLSDQVVTAVFTAPDLAKRYRLRDGVELWETVNREIGARPIRDLAADAVIRIARGVDETALREAFLAVSPAARPAPREMIREQIREQELDQVQRKLLFWLLSDRWLEREVSTLRSEGNAEFLCPPYSGELPFGISDDLPEEGIVAWKEMARLEDWYRSQPNPQAVVDGKAPGRGRANVGALSFEEAIDQAFRIEGAIDRFFQNPQAVELTELNRFDWTSGMWCGSGGDESDAVVGRVVLMMHVRDRRVAAAVHAMLHGSQGVRSSWQEPLDWRSELLALCGLDLEKLLSSSFLPYRAGLDRGRLTAFFAAHVLGARGSTFAAKLLLALESRAQEKDRGERRRIICKFITPGDVFPGTRPEVSPELQRALVELLVADLQRPRDYSDLANSLEGLARLQRVEIKEAIRPLLSSPYQYVAQNASRALFLMGESPGQLPVRGSARFQIYLNGEPWAFEQGAFPVIRYESNGGHGGLTSMSRGPLLEFGHDEVVQAMENMTNAHLVLRPPPEELTTREATLAQPWFAVPLAMPISLKEVNEARAMTQPLEVQVRYSHAVSADSGEYVRLEMTWLDEPGRAKPSPSVFLEPIKTSYRFAALQPGRYRLAVTAPGCARRESGTIEVKKGMTTLVLTLDPASEVHAK